MASCAIASRTPRRTQTGPGRKNLTWPGEPPVGSNAVVMRRGILREPRGQAPRWSRAGRPRRHPGVPGASGSLPGSARRGIRPPARTRNRHPCPRWRRFRPATRPASAISRRSIVGSGLAGVSRVRTVRSEAAKWPATPLASRIIRENRAGLFEARAMRWPRDRSTSSVSATPGRRCDFSTATSGYRSRKRRTPSAARSLPTASSSSDSRPCPTMRRTRGSGSGASPSLPIAKASASAIAS